MQTERYSHHVHLASELEFFAALSEAHTPEAILNVFLRHRPPVRIFTYHIMFVPEPTPPGQSASSTAYRLISAGPLPPAESDEFSASNDAASLELYELRQGGLLGELCTSAMPVALSAIRHSPDDPFPPGLGCGVLVPIFDDDPPGQRLLLLRPGNDLPSAEDVAVGLGEANLLSRLISLARVRHQVATLNERLNAQLDEVVRVQQSLLPQSAPVCPGLRIASAYLPSGAAGGDYFDFVQLPDGSLGVVIADVSGHGPGAAVIMAQMRAATHSAVLSGTERPAVEINAILSAAMSPGMFVTAILSLIDPSTGRVGSINCGHPPARILRRNGLVEPMPGVSCMPLGIVPDLDPPADAGSQTVLNPGDRLLFYTDGVTEAMNPQRELFTTERLDETLSACPQGAGVDGAQAMIDAVLAAVNAHRGDAAANDDICMVAIERI